MSGYDLLRRVVTALEAAGIPYMTTGSFASSHHGKPRATQDIDLVISPTAEQLKGFVRSLSSPEYYVAEQTALAALMAEDQFNVIDSESGWKVDLIIRKSRPFSLTEFERRTQTTVQGVPMHVASAEDVLIAKLEWARKGGSQRQVEDAAGILEVRGAELDMKYIEHWVDQLGLQDQWAAARTLGHR